MIVSTRRTQILMSKDPTDMRLGFNGLQKQAKKLFKTNPYQGQFFVFVNRRRSSCKVYTYDGTGDVLICKRLSQGVFCRPNPSYKKRIRMTGSEFSQFFEGLNISGRILESSPNSKPTKKLLRFIRPYRKLTPSDAAGGINTRQSSPPSSPE
jgi:transposase